MGRLRGLGVAAAVSKSPDREFVTVEHSEHLDPGVTKYEGLGLRPGT